MKKRSSKRQNNDSDDAQNRCIWMTAGVISFKLCPYDFDCEHCDFDKAMRTHIGSQKIKARVKKQRSNTEVRSKKNPPLRPDSKRSFLFFTFSANELDKGFYLHPAHLWARQMEDGNWKVGIDNLLAYILPPPAKFEFYDLSSEVFQDQTLGKIITEGGPVFLTAPLSGKLIQTNPKLAQHPELVLNDPYGQGWLAILNWSRNHKELEKLHAQGAGRRFLEEEAQHLKFLLKHKGIKVDQIGDTLRDGGADIKQLHQVLPTEVCLKLVGELTVTGKQAW
jgi:glycine cleavage system H protein